jgi:hypothetical protein
MHLGTVTPQAWLTTLDGCKSLHPPWVSLICLLGWHGIGMTFPLFVSHHCPRILDTAVINLPSSLARFVQYLIVSLRLSPFLMCLLESN